MFSFFTKKPPQNGELITSSLYDEITFYKQFISDLQKCHSEVIIESPYITRRRMNILFPTFAKLIRKGIKIYIITRNPAEYTDAMGIQSELAIQRFERTGIQVFLCDGNHHRKLAIIDRGILWEGSLNILSQNNSREIMRRIISKKLSGDMFNFLNLAQIFQ